MLTTYLKNNRFKSRSLPNSKTLGRYLTALMVFIAVLGVYNFIYICLIANDFKIVIPDLILIALPMVFVTIYHKIENEYKAVSRHDILKILMFIQVGHSQALSEALDERPELLSQKYQRKSLLYWAKYYNNKDAHSIIAKRMALLASSKK